MRPSRLRSPTRSKHARRIRQGLERSIVAAEQKLFVAPLMQEIALGVAEAGRRSDKRQALRAQPILVGTGFECIGQVDVDVSQQLRIAERTGEIERTQERGLTLSGAAAVDEGGADLGERLCLAQRHAELAKHFDRFIELQPRLVVPEREIVGQREAAERLRALEDAIILGGQIERLTKEPQALDAIARAVGGGRTSQQILERCA